MHREVSEFLEAFYESFQSRSSYEIRQFYPSQFHRMSEKHFADKSWPEPFDVAQALPFIGEDKVFYALYTELYYRHLHWHLPEEVTIYKRFDSWASYRKLFGILSEAQANVVVPHEWLFDIVTDFVYQFQDFTTYKSMKDRLISTEIKVLESNPLKWNAAEVARTLYNVSKSNGILRAAAESMGSIPSSTPSSASPLAFSLGYFALAGLCRVQLLMGDYHSTDKILDVEEALRNSGNALTPRLTVCQVQFQYFRGFTQILLRNYGGAIRTLSKMLHRIQNSELQNKSRSVHSRSILKKYEKCLYLLAIAHSLCPAINFNRDVREAVYKKTEAYIDMMQSVDENVAFKAFEACFNIGCIKYTTGNGLSKLVTAHHRDNIFLKDMQHRHHLPMIYKLLRMYKTLSLKRLVELGSDASTQVDDEAIESMRRRLIALKFKTRVEGDDRGFRSAHFWLENDVLQIQQEAKRRNLGMFYADQIRKLNAVTRECSESDA